MCLPFKQLKEWTDDKTKGQGEHLGFEWEIVSNRMGYLCGYVKVGPGHPWYGKDYDDIAADVHGGLTFSEYGKACPAHGPTDEYWVGFDCGHWGDAPKAEYMDPEYRKALADLYHDSTSSFKDEFYVQKECERLAEQALAAQQAA